DIEWYIELTYRAQKDYISLIILRDLRPCRNLPGITGYLSLGLYARALEKVVGDISVASRCTDSIDDKDSILRQNALDLARLYSMNERYAEALDLCRAELAILSKRSDVSAYFDT